LLPGDACIDIDCVSESLVAQDSGRPVGIPVDFAPVEFSGAHRERVAFGLADRRNGK